MASKHDEMLGRTDPLEFWLQEANLRPNANLGISPVEALAIIKGAFSESWLRDQVTAEEKGTAIQSSRHPLARLILLPGKNQIPRVLELALYLRDLYAVANLDQVIQQLKSASDFENTWIQLAYGYRFHKIGASNLKFEPDVDQGRKADIIFKFEAHTYLVECFKPEIQDSWMIELASRAHKQIFDFTDAHKKVVCIKAFIREKPAFNTAERKSFEQTWKALIKEIKNQDELNAETDSFKIKVQEISHLNQSEREELFQKMFNENGCRFAYKQSLMDKNDALNTMRGKGKKTYTRDLLFFHSDEKEEDIGNLINRLSKKMEKKVSQLKMKDSGAKSLLIVASPLIHPRNASDRKSFDRMRGKVLDAHPHVDAAILVHPTDGPQGDPRYGGTIFLPSSPREQLDILEKLEELEIKGALLTK